MQFLDFLFIELLRPLSISRYQMTSLKVVVVNKRTHTQTLKP